MGSTQLKIQMGSTLLAELDRVVKEYTSNSPKGYLHQC